MALAFSFGVIAVVMALAYGIEYGLCFGGSAAAFLYLAISTKS